MQKYDTVIFDLDGTLLDTLEDLCDSTNFALAEFGYPKRSLQEVRSFVGNGIGVLIEKALPQGKADPLYGQVLETFKAHYTLNCNNKTHAYEGINELLERLNEAGYKIAVVSNKVDSAVKELCEQYFKDTIKIAIGETEKIKRKPGPDEVYAAIIKVLSPGPKDQKEMDRLFSLIRKTPPPDVCHIINETEGMNEAIRIIDGVPLNNEQLEKIKVLFMSFKEDNKGVMKNG